MNLCRQLFGSRKLWFAVIIASTIMASPHSARAFTDADLNEAAGCIARWHSTSGKIRDITDVMQLTFDGQGGVTGRLHFLISGEDCLATVGNGSGYTVNADGSGTLTLSFSFSGSDTDNDFNCASLNASNVGTQKMTFVLERAGHVFDMAAQDDFFSASSDGGDTPFTLTGSCQGQGKF